MPGTPPPAVPDTRRRRGAARRRIALAAVVALPLTTLAAVTGTSSASAATCNGNAAVYGADGSELTFSVLDDPAGGGGLSVVNHVKDLGYTPRTLVALDYKTLLATDSSGNLHKLDVVTNSTGGTVRDTVWVSGGWTHDHLAYDGAGHLYGTAGGNLLRYDLSSGFTSIGPRQIVAQGGYVVDTLFANAPNSLIATNADGALINYKVNPTTNSVGRHVLRSSTWRFRNMISPGGGVYYGQTTAGAMNHYIDTNPVDGSGTDISYPKAISTRGWTQHLLAAVPGTCDAVKTIAERAVLIALDQVGKPYVWGAEGPNSFDCSGLVHYAYENAGFYWRDRETADSLYNRGYGRKVLKAEHKRGDLIFFNSDSDAAMDHVIIDIGGNRTVEAQRTGTPVKTADLTSARLADAMPYVVRLVG